MGEKALASEKGDGRFGGAGVEWGRKQKGLWHDHWGQHGKV